MAVIHQTTITPTKLEMVAGWLPRQPWYLGGKGTAPVLDKAGGFRLDDPEGEVGIEFMVVVDTAADRPVVYHVPVAYRGAPLEGAEEALISTGEHGVLGRRWVYDGSRDPVAVAQLVALVRGEAEPQAQSETATPDPSVVGRLLGPVPGGPFAGSSAVDGAEGTDLLVRTGPEADGGPSGDLALRIVRVLAPGDGGDAAETPAGPLGEVVAGWRLPDGAAVRGRFAVVRDAASERRTR